MPLFENLNQLVVMLSGMNEILSIGKSGGAQFPAPNESDVDLFIFCSEVPDAKTRSDAMKNLGPVISDMKISEHRDRFWGVCDYFNMEETEICLMYFTISEMNDEIESVLRGSRLDREDEYFYPTGRCATMLLMHPLYDGIGYISSAKKKLSQYPQPLAEALYRHHIPKINDEEDFTRAIARGDVLFYHTTLELAMDHFLQALFALNYCFFPSRKRTIQLIDGLKSKPQDCSKRLLKVVALGSNPDTLSLSYEAWTGLCQELLDYAP